jgi:hypothetical protein
VSRIARLQLVFCTAIICFTSTLCLGALTRFTVTPLQVGDHLTEYAYQVDKIEWKLPKKRLEHFRKAGVVIQEDHRITIVAQAVVVSTSALGPSLQTQEHIIAIDVPRQQTSAIDQDFLTPLAPDNEPRASYQFSSEAEAAMVGLPIAPKRPASVGQRWSTHLNVVTMLGSGSVTFDHVISAFTNGRVEIMVKGRGKITGTEYHLPKLLPGSIEITGTAWYDPISGLVTQESYLIHNQLLKPAEGEFIGFDEHLTVDATTRKL